MSEIKLHTHTVQKNYSAIWYSLLIHFVLLVTAANYAKINISAAADDIAVKIKNKIFSMLSSRELNPSHSYINELYLPERKGGRRS